MYTWPSHYPNQCPPDNAEALSGLIFRFINKKDPEVTDFESYYEKKPENDWSHAECQSRGLSVLKSFEDCQVMRAAIPALRKKNLVFGKISSNIGLIANTPSKTCKGQYTWWLAIPANEVLIHFVPFDEQKVA